MATGFRNGRDLSCLRRLAKPLREALKFPGLHAQRLNHFVNHSYTVSVGLLKFSKRHHYGSIPMRYRMAIDVDVIPCSIAWLSVDSIRERLLVVLPKVLQHSGYVADVETPCDLDRPRLSEF
jgi:hypothetical protein